MTLNKKMDILNYMNKLDFNDYLCFLHGRDETKELKIWKKLLNKGELTEKIKNYGDLWDIYGWVKNIKLKELDNNDFYYLLENDTYSPAIFHKQEILKEIGNEIRSNITIEELQTWLLGVKI